jgi:methionyl-tRNA formyltransferase
MSKQIVFFGTPKIAASCLQALLDANIDVLAVVTKPDMPVGHKQKIKESAVKILAKQHNILVLQPHKLNDIYNQLNELKADLFIVCAYGKLINEKILRLPKFHCINVHTSLLPRWRGGAPIHYAILAGDKLSGISLMYMSKELDAGNVIYQQTIPIDQYETYHSLYDKLAKLAYHTLKNKIHSLFDLHIPSQSQDVSFVTFAKNINRTDELIK